MAENKAVEFFKKNISTIIVVIISIFYIFWGSVELHLKNLDWWELACYVGSTLVFGICIADLVGEPGFKAGKENEKYKNTRALLIRYCDAAIPYKEEAIKYVNDQIDREIKEERKTILTRAAITYDEIFDEVGNTKNFEKGKYTKKQKKSVRQAIRLKKYDFTLFAYSTVKVVGRKKEQSENEYRAKGFGKDFIVRIVLAIITGSVMFTFNGMSIAALIYAVFQMIIWVASGVMKRQKNYNFIVVTLREADLDRIGYLKSFLAYKGYKEVDGKLVLDKSTQILEN